MQLVKAGTLLPPNVCVLCEESKPEGSLLVDTFRHLLDAMPHVFPSGRKYVCESCVVEMARLFGLVSDAKLKAAEAERDACVETVKYVAQKASALAKELSLLSSPSTIVLSRPEVESVPVEA